MSVHIPASAVQAVIDDRESNSDRSSESEEDNRELETFDDWVEEQAPCKSLFDDKILSSAQACVEYDRTTHGFDVIAMSTKLGLDFLGRAKLINYIRKQSAAASELANLSGNEGFFSEDEFLKPTIEDDPLLQMDAPEADDSDFDDAEPAADSSKGPSEAAAARKIAKLQSKLSEANKDLQELRKLVQGRVDLLEVSGSAEAGPVPRDDDTHYFDSYSYNEIHAVMIQDTVRTSSYSKFILSNPLIFKDAVVLDVGCGTGILSLFAARAGARKVIAIDASDIAEKAKQIVKANDFDHIVTVVRGTVEDLDVLPDGITSVDVIISEWMGYCCIYESMLDSVLVARDKFLRKDGCVVTGEDGEEVTKGPGLMAPSQCRIVLGLADSSDVIRERIKFWDDVLGFKMTAMANEVYDESVVDIIAPESILGEAANIKDITIQHISSKSLDFVSPFKLTSARSGELNSFVVWFDTFFTVDGKDVPADAKVELHTGDWAPGEVMRVGERRLSESGRSKTGDDAQTSAIASIPEGSITGQPLSSAPDSISPPPPPAPPAPPAPPLPPVSSQPQSILTNPTRRPSMRARSMSRRASSAYGLPRPVSFSTGPYSMPTHWKQSIFLLRDPIKVRKGAVIEGTFHCRKSADNSRELDVEIHYVVEDVTLGGTREKSKEATVQMFKVR